MMEKEDFYKILCTYTPEMINNFISIKGKRKMVNLITFVDKNTTNCILEDKDGSGESRNSEHKR